MPFLSHRKAKGRLAPFLTGKEVTVSDRVSNGPIKNPLQIELYVSNEEGKTYRTYAMVRNYCGKGELFEAKYTVLNRVKWQRVVAIESN